MRLGTFATIGQFAPKRTREHRQRSDVWASRKNPLFKSIFAGVNDVFPSKSSVESRHPRPQRSCAAQGLVGRRHGVGLRCGGDLEMMLIPCGLGTSMHTFAMHQFSIDMSDHIPGDGIHSPNVKRVRCIVHLRGSSSG